MFIPSTFKRPVSSWKALNLRKPLLMASSVRLKPLNCSRLPCVYAQFFFFNDTATTEIYTLSLHDALPIFFLDNLTRFSGYSEAGPIPKGDSRIAPAISLETHVAYYGVGAAGNGSVPVPLVWLLVKVAGQVSPLSDVARWTGKPPSPGRPVVLLI